MVWFTFQWPLPGYREPSEKLNLNTVKQGARMYPLHLLIFALRFITSTQLFYMPIIFHEEPHFNHGKSTEK